MDACSIKPVELEPTVSHEHLVEELREEGDLEGALLVVVGPVVEQDAEGHGRAVELPGLGLRVGMHLSRINQYLLYELVQLINRYH